MIGDCSEIFSNAVIDQLKSRITDSFAKKKKKKLQWVLFFFSYRFKFDWLILFYFFHYCVSFYTKKCHGKFIFMLFGHDTKEIPFCVFCFNCFVPSVNLLKPWTSVIVLQHFFPYCNIFYTFFQYKLGELREICEIAMKFISLTWSSVQISFLCITARHLMWLMQLLPVTCSGVLKWGYSFF